MNAATGRFLAGAYDRPPRPAAPEPAPQLPPPAPTVPARQLSLAEAMATASPERLLIGQNAAGELAVFNPALHGHAAIVGATGTGTSAAFMAAAGALRAGYQLVIFDPEDGADWGLFRRHAQVSATDRIMFPEQVMALLVEYERRATAPGQPLLCIIEEYGALIHELRLAKRSEAERVDQVLDLLLRRGRKRAVHLLLVDQYPEHWSQQVIAGTKFRAVFRLGPNQGAKMEEYKAAQLPDRGAFLCGGAEYAAWHAQPAMRQLLAAIPAHPHPVIDGSCTPVHAPVQERPAGGSTSGERPVNTPTNAPMNAPVNAAPDTVEGWYEWTLAQYLPAHPELLTLDAQGRGVGVRGLAAAMAQLARGDAGQYEAYKGAASEVGKRLRREVRLAGGDAIGTDVSHA